jgi:hypothetical protein
MIVLNVTHRDQKLTEGSLLAHCEALTMVTPLDVEQPQVRASMNLQDATAAAKPNMSDAESQELEELLTEYEDTFARDNNDYGWTDRVYHRIHTGKV